MARAGAGRWERISTRKLPSEGSPGTALRGADRTQQAPAAGHSCYRAGIRHAQSSNRWIEVYIQRWSGIGVGFGLGAARSLDLTSTTARSTPAVATTPFLTLPAI